MSQWGLNPQPLDQQSNALPDELSHYLVVGIKSCSIDSRNKQSAICEVVHETKESSLQKSPTDFLVAQLSEQQTDDLEVMSSNPTRGNFILFCVTLDLSDNLTEICIVKNSNVLYFVQKSLRWFVLILVCESGYGEVDGNCTMCPIGFYKPEISNALCEPCGADKRTTTTRGSNAFSNCSKYSPHSQSDRVVWNKINEMLNLQLELSVNEL